MALIKKEKPKLIEKLKKMVDEYKVIGILNMHKLPAKQLQKMKQMLGGKAVISMSRKSLLKMALLESSKNKKGIEKLAVSMKDEPALIFTNENPFKIYQFLKKNKTAAPARSGDIAAKDIVISKGSTGLPPGPAISTLQSVGLKTTVQSGKIAVANDKIVLEAGKSVTPELANVLSLLKLEPMEIGLDVLVVYEDGIMYEKNVLNIDEDEYMKDINLAINEMINLSINAGYLIPETVELAIRKAFIEAKSIGLEADIITNDTVGDILAKAVRQAKALDEKIEI